MIQIYTGDGKGKTTAAVGLAVRAAGAGLKVLFLQVIKNGASSEIKVLESIPKITVKTFGSGERIFPDRENLVEKQKVAEAMQFVTQNISSFQVIIIDELVTAVQLGLAEETEVLTLTRRIPKKTELVLTGHGASAKLAKAADLVTEMKPLKHYYEKGTLARKGIEL